jgi:hypothetical protein
MLTECVVVRLRSNADGEPYEVHFTAQGRQYACPLYAFQPRTESWYADAQPVSDAQAAVAV